MDEFCYYPEFRSQLEDSENSINFFKRAIHEPDTEFAHNLVGALRHLCLSPIILQRLMDQLTIPKLFEIYSQVLEYGDKDVYDDVLGTLNHFATQTLTRSHVAKNQNIIAVLLSSITKEDPDICNQAGKLFVDLLEDRENGGISIFEGFDIFLDAVVAYESNPRHNPVHAEKILEIISENDTLSQALQKKMGKGSKREREDRRVRERTRREKDNRRERDHEESRRRDHRSRDRRHSEDENDEDY